MRRDVRLIPIIVFCCLAAGCTSFWQAGSSSGSRDGVSSSLVDYLYPKGEVPPEQPEGIPRLDLPLRAGIAFVPSRYPSGFGSGIGIPEATKAELLARVRDAFADREYIAHIEVIPETYLRSSQGFEGMQQVARLYGLDVMALVSYDQVSVSHDTDASVLYWTIVGAYVVKGTKNAVNTFVDTAVFDVPTRRLLFRAPGTDQRDARSTAVESNETLRRERTGSFAAAMDKMTVNLEAELERFEDRLKSEPTLAEVNWEEGKGGSGSFGLLALLALLAMGLAAPQLTSSERRP